MITLMFNARELKKITENARIGLYFSIRVNKFRIKYNNNTNRTFGLWPPTL